MTTDEATLLTAVREIRTEGRSATSESLAARLDLLDDEYERTRRAA